MKILLFFRKETFSNLVFTFITEKKIAKNNYNFFFRIPKCKKKFAISKTLNKKFRKIHYFANIKYKINSRKHCEKNFRRNIFVQRKIFAKKNSIKKMFTRKRFVEKNYRKKNFSKKKNSKKILAIFLYLKKNSV